jgi:hypothetical protein
MNDLPNTPPPAALNENGELEDRQAEQRDHDVGRPGDDLDARFDHAREPRRAPVLGDPQRAADGERGRERDPDHGQQRRPDQRVEEAAAAALGGAQRGTLHEQARAQVLDPAVAHVDDDRTGDQAQPDAGRPREHKRQTVDPAPAQRRGAPPRPALHRRSGRQLLRAPLADRVHPRTWYLRKGSLIR